MKVLNKFFPSFQAARVPPGVPWPPACFSPARGNMGLLAAYVGTDLGTFS